MKDKRDFETPYANLFLRFTAYAIDYALLIATLLLPQILLAFLTRGWPFNRLITGPQIEVWILLTISLPAWTYFALSEKSKWQGTLGKRLLGLRVISGSGDRLTLKQAILRTIIKLIPWELSHLTLMLPIPIWDDTSSGFRLGLIIAYLLIAVYIGVMFFSTERRSIHDHIANTFVLRNKRAKIIS